LGHRWKGLREPSFEGSIFLTFVRDENTRTVEMLDVTFSFKHDCYYCNLSRELPDLTMIVCCNDAKDIIEVVSPSQANTEKAIRKLRESGAEVERSERGNRVMVVTDRCLCNICEDNETKMHMDLGVLLVSPRVFCNGWEQRRILGFNNGHVKDILKSLQEHFPTKIISKRPVQGGLSGEFFSPTSNQLFGHMTDRQMEAILLARREGYYISPRKTTTAKLAKAFGTTRATYEEHLRKAENKLIRVLCDYIDVGPSRKAANMRSGGAVVDPGSYAPVSKADWQRQGR